MTPHELIMQLTNIQGPCGRYCCYCDEEFHTAEVKECVEKMYKEIYALQSDKDKLLEEILKLRKAYRDITGKDYKDEDH